MIELKVDRLVQISQHTAILTGGAADGGGDVSCPEEFSHRGKAQRYSRGLWGCVTILEHRI
jgi:hypothetical protein